MAVTRRSCPFFIVVFPRRSWDSVSQPSPQSVVRDDVNDQRSARHHGVSCRRHIGKREDPGDEVESKRECASRASLVFGSSLTILIIIIMIIIIIIIIIIIKLINR